MATVQQVLDALEIIAPSRFAFDFDRIGLQVGDPSATVDRAVVSLDRSLAAIEFCESSSAQLLLAHHPLIWDPLKSLVARRHEERSALRLVRGGINFIAAHTNWDCARGGINDALASLLGLSDVKEFGSAADVAMAKLVCFAPTESVDGLIEAASAAGAGVIGEYSECAFRSDGVGSFLCGPNSNPTVGTPGERERAQETRFEMVLPASRISAVSKAIRANHPYEEPAFDIFPLQPWKEQSAGRVGKFAEKMPLSDFLALINDKLATKAMAWGDPERLISKVAVVGGAADSEWMYARTSGADVLVTGEVKQNVAVEASESGLAIVAAGHYATEHPGCAALRNRLDSALPEVEWLLFEPKRGLGGRPLQ